MPLILRTPVHLQHLRILATLQVQVEQRLKQPLLILVIVRIHRTSVRLQITQGLQIIRLLLEVQTLVIVRILRTLVNSRIIQDLQIIQAPILIIQALRILQTLVIVRIRHMLVRLQIVPLEIRRPGTKLHLPILLRMVPLEIPIHHTVHRLVIALAIALILTRRGLPRTQLLT